MGRLGESSFYELLGVSTDATVEEIEASYQRMAGVMSPDSLAMYSMLEDDESARLRAQIDEAYLTLTDAESRAAYDRTNPAEQSNSGYPSVMIPAEAKGGSNLSVGRVRRDHDASASPAPGAATASPAPVAASPVPATALPSPVARVEPEVPAPVVRAPGPEESAKVLPTPRATTRQPVAPARRGRLLQPNVSIEVTSDTECSGALLRRLRESADANLDAVAEITKISKRYLHALEENDFDTLPAAVYVRGFVSEYARALGLDPRLVAKSYMALYKRYRGEDA